MATKKTTSTKRAPAKKSVAAKPTAKKTPIKKATAPRATKSTQKKVAKQPAVQSFKIVDNPERFMTLRISRQTIYWIIFGVAVIALALWVANLQRNINELYDQIEQTQAESQMLLPAEIEALKKQKAEREARRSNAANQQPTQ